MTLFARSDLASVSVSAAHGGCGTVHVRPAPGGKPDQVWKLDCAPCEAHLRSDPLWSPTISEVPATPDVVNAREDFQMRGAIDRDQVMALAMAKLAGVELPDTMRRPISGLAPHVPTIVGEIECTAGHPNEPGSKYCSECGSPMRDAVLLCPDGHPVSVGEVEVLRRVRPAGHPGPGARGRARASLLPWPPGCPVAAEAAEGHARG